jgi:flagella basal body P-ring formation protein FlgA
MFHAVQQLKGRAVSQILHGLLAVALLGPLMAHAQTLAAPVTAAEQLYAQAQVWLDSAVSQTDQKADLQLRMEVTVGELDRRLRLAPCQDIQPYLPPGTRLWGKTRMGLRCARGEVKWNVFLPITVKAMGPAWVMKGQLAQGTVLSQTDAMLAEVDWAEVNSPVVANAQDWLGQTAARGLSAGQALRQDMIRATQIFQPGTQVRVLAQGSGFEVATSGQALTGGVLGQSVRVRMDNGRVLVGQVLDAQTVRIAL